MPKGGILVKNYNDLRENSMVPKLLVVVIVPESQEDWMEQDREKLVLKKCAYWYNLKGMQDSNNSSSVRILIPLEQIFTTEFLKLAMKKIANGEEL